MSSGGRGRGYSGRHHNRSLPRPGDCNSNAEDLDTTTARSINNLSPRSHEIKPEPLRKMEVRQDVSLHQDIIKEPPKAPKMTPLSAEDEAAIAELIHIDDCYKPLLVLLEQFLPGEDGIQFNQKLRNFETTITNLCPDEPRLLAAFATFRAAALRCGATSRKLASVGASFTRQQRQQVLRSTLLNVVMQGTYSKLDLLEKANPQYLVNAANLMGDYFAEARLSNGNKVHILAAPLLQYMKSLLKNNDIRAHRSLATQLMQNGRELLSVLSQELDELSICIRRRLLQPLPVSIVWLLLSSDLCLNKFLPLPNTLQKFYASHLELSQDDGNFSEVDYGSWKRPEEDTELDLSLTEHVNQSLNLSFDENGVKPKMRPILGAGASQMRQDHNVLTVSQDCFDTWAPKSKNRHDLNSWRQNNPDNHEENTEPVFDPTVLPPNLNASVSQQNLQSHVVIPDYPPPNINRFTPKETFPNYLQQGDGTYIQSQYNDRPNQTYQPHGDGTYYQPQRETTPEKNLEARPPTTKTPEKPPRIEKQLESPTLPEREKVLSEVQKTSARRQVENWRKEKSDATTEDRNKQRNWTRQSRDNINEEEPEADIGGSRSSVRDIRPGNRQNRRESLDSDGKEKPRRHVTEVPRSHRYWDHDDRCDIDYNS